MRFRSSDATRGLSHGLRCGKRAEGLGTARSPPANHHERHQRGAGEGRPSLSRLARPGTNGAPPRNATDRFFPQPLGSRAQPEIDIEPVIGPQNPAWTYYALSGIGAAGLHLMVTHDSARTLEVRGEVSAANLGRATLRYPEELSQIDASERSIRFSVGMPVAGATRISVLPLARGCCGSPLRPRRRTSRRLRRGASSASRPSRRTRPSSAGTRSPASRASSG